MLERYPSLPLQNRKFLVTRTREGNIMLKERLERLGASVVEFNSIEILPPSSFYQLDKALENLLDFEWIIFTSANGVRAFFKRLKEKYGIKLFFQHNKARFGCVGPGTATALKEEAGIDASFIPTQFTTESLAAELCMKFDIHQKKILIVRAENAKNRIGPIFSKYGAHLALEVPSYRTSSANTKNVLPINQITDIIFASPSSVDSFAQAGISGNKLMEEGIVVHCIGPITSKRAFELGFKVETISEVHTIDGLVKTITEYYTARRYMKS
jgi:uroporphyrinogen III methyltransferase/synthase